MCPKACRRMPGKPRRYLGAAWRLRHVWQADAEPGFKLCGLSQRSKVPQTYETGPPCLRGKGERIDMNARKLLQKALASPANLRFGEACTLARAFGFHLSRVSGSHHIFAHEGVRELVNLQDVGGKEKPYQVKQLLDLVERYNLSLGGEE